MANALRDFFATGPDTPESTDRGWIDATYRRHRVRVMLAITLGYALIYTCRLAISMVKKPLIDGGIFSAEQLGVIGSALYFAYAVGKLTNGFFADHCNMRRFLTFSFATSAVTCIAMGFADAFVLAVVLWGLNGWFQSFGAPGGVVAMTAWYSNRERGRMYGIWSTAHSMGEGLTFLVVGGLVAALGWRWGYWGAAALGVIASIGAWRLLVDRPRTLGLPTVADWKDDHYGDGPKADAKSVLGLQLSILKIPSIWVLCLAAATTYVTRYGINSWGVLYLQETRGYSELEAGSWLFLSTLAGIAGAVAYGFTSDKLFAARRPPANLLFAVVEIVGLLLIFYAPHEPLWLTIGLVLFGLGLTGLVTSLGGLFAVDIAPKRVAGAAMGVIGIFSYIGAGVQDLVSGLLIGRGTQMVDGVRHYDFDAAIVFWIGSSVVSMALAASLWRTKLRD